MTASKSKLKPRRLGNADYKRGLIVLAVLAIIAPLYWLGLPSLQAKFLPEAPGGESGPWLVRPITAVRYGAMAIMAAATMPFIIRPLRKVWDQEDKEMGSKYKPLHKRPWEFAAVAIKATALFVVYGAALVFYLFSWTLIEPDGIKQRLPWTTLNHSYDAIASLKTIPDGERSESLIQNGPWYSVRLTSGRTIPLSPANEGTTPEELQAMTQFIAKQSGQDWEKWEDSQRR